MAFVIVERWQQTKDVEVFYDLAYRKIVYKKFNWVYTQSVDTGQSNKYADLQNLRYFSISMKFLGAAFSPDEQHLAFHLTQTDIDIINVATLSRFTLRIGRGRTILGYHWSESSFLADFALVHSGGVDFYRLQPQPLKLVLVKSFASSTSQYWFEPRSGTIVLAHSPTKPGSLRAYFFYQGKLPKFDGPKFKLVQTIPASSNWTSRLSNSMSMTAYNEMIGEVENAHKCVLAKIYDAVYFLHLTYTTGQVQLYQVNFESVLLMSTVIYRIPGIYDLFVIDNLIVMQSMTDQEEYFYDIKAANFPNVPFSVVRYGIRTVPAKVSVTIIPIGDKVGLSINLDGVPIRLLSDIVDKPKFLEKSDRLPTSLIRVDQDILIDDKEGRCYRVEVKPLELIETQDSLTTVLLFLLRRKGLKMDALMYLRQRVLEQVSIRSLSDFFMTINKVYRQAALERKNEPKRPTGKSQTFIDSVSTRSSTQMIDTEVKIEAGTTVMLQNDMYNLVLLDIFEDKTLPPHYVTSVLLEYQRSLIFHEIHVNLNIQLLIAKHLVRIKNYALLHSMLQYHILIDCKEISHLLLAVGNPGNYAHYPPALQLAVDMLIRLKDYREVINLLLERQLVYEVLVCIDQERPGPECLEALKDALKTMEDQETVAVIKDFIAGWEQTSSK